MDENTSLTLIFGIITIVALILEGLLLSYRHYIHYKKIRTENETLKESIIKLKSQNHEEYDRRILEKIRELLSGAKKEIRVCGLVGHQPIHECQLEIVKLVNNHKGKVRILIANPDSDYFKSRVKNEGDINGRLISGYHSTIIELENILKDIKDQDRLRIKLYKNGIEDVSFWIADDNEMFVNKYTNKNSRGYYSKMFKVSNERLAQQYAFDYYTKLFESAWKDKSSIELDLLKKI